MNQPILYLEMFNNDVPKDEAQMFIRVEVVDKAEAVTQMTEYANDPDYFQGVSFTARLHLHNHVPNEPCPTEGL